MSEEGALDEKGSRKVRRRTILKAGIGTLGAAWIAGPFIIRARAESPVRIGLIEPLTGTYAVSAQNAVHGTRLALDQINGKGGILGRPIELLIEDSANSVDIGVLKARKLIDLDRVDFLLGDQNSDTAQAMAHVTSDKGVLHIIPGAHTDPITGTDCHWNVFRVCNTNQMLANAIARKVAENLGKKWYFITADYAFGHTLQAAFEAQLKILGGTKVGGDLSPLGTTDFSAYLLKARAAKPDVLMLLVAGSDQVNALKRVRQLGLDKELSIAGGLQELEPLEQLPSEARIGWWVFEWYWKQPGVAGVDHFVAAIKQRTQKMPTARTWFSYVAMHTLALMANQEKTLDAVKLAQALGGFTLPADVALQPHALTYRKSDHQLLASAYVGNAKTLGDDPEDLFEVTEVIPGQNLAPENTGCTMRWN
jgi:branched-chain amino acid transport system substrate-binding protein